MNIQKLRNFGRNKLIENNIGDAIFKAELLLEYTLKMSKTEIIINSEKEVPNDLEQKYIFYLDEVIAGKPVQYITHKQEFMKLDFYVDENVLIPQPDTEILVEEVLKIINLKILELKSIKENRNTINLKEKDNIKDMVGKRKTEKNSELKILDLCTGSGAIAISLEKYLKNKFKTEIIASDVSKKAIEIAKRNAEENNAKVKLIISDMFENIKEKNFDIIVSNPPYIESRTITTLSKEVQNEPVLALDGGTDGLDFYRIIAKEAYKYIKSGGHILVEIGYNQKENVSNIFKETAQKYTGIKCIKDLNKQDRIIEMSVN